MTLKILSITKLKLQKKMSHMWAHLLLRAIRARILISIWWRKNLKNIFYFSLLSFITLSFWFCEQFQQVLEPYFIKKERIDTLRSVLLASGGALIAVVVIVVPLIIFAMQVNIDRMPHRLFSKFSSDKKMIKYFGAALLGAIAVMCLPLIAQDASQVALVIVCAIWAGALVLFCASAAYQRALRLVNPNEQLGFVLRHIKKDLRMWSKRADIARPLLEQVAQTDMVGEASRLHLKYDIPRMMFFKMNQGWTSEATRGLSDAGDLARRYAEKADYQVADNALKVIVTINEQYISAKGKTFFSKNPLSGDTKRDPFILYTLENLRKAVLTGIGRGDKQQTKQILQAMAELVSVYTKIEDANPHAFMTDAHLAAEYLSEAVTDTLRLEDADVLMDGVKFMGQAAAHVCAKKDTYVTVTLLRKKIEEVSLLGAKYQKFQPVTKVGVEQLTQLTLMFLKIKNSNVGRTLQDINESMLNVTNNFLQVPDLYGNIHITCLESYYEKMVYELQHLKEICLQAKKYDVTYSEIIDNFKEWSANLALTIKGTFLLTVEKRSHFFFYLVHWIINVSEILLALAESPSCKNVAYKKQRQKQIWKQSKKLFDVLWEIPYDDKENVRFLENYRLTDILFNAIRTGQQYHCPEFVETARKLLLMWGLRAGRFSGSRAFEDTVYGLATLALTSDMADHETTRMKKELHSLLALGPDRQERASVACRIRERSETMYQTLSSSSEIELAMASVDPDKMEALLKELADILSPETAVGPVVSQ